MAAAAADSRLKCMVCGDKTMAHVTFDSACKCKEKVCLRCCLQWLKTDTKSEMKCPQCKIPAVKFTMEYTVDNIKASWKEHDRARPIPLQLHGLDDDDDEEEVRWRVSYIAGIRADEHGRVEYKAVGKMAKGAFGQPHVEWKEAPVLFRQSDCEDGQAGLNNPNVTEFHARFNIPTVSDERFQYSFKFEHSVPVVKKVNNVTKFCCNECPRTFPSQKLLWDTSRRCMFLPSGGARSATTHGSRPDTR